MRFKVTVESAAIVSTTVEIEAPSKEEAEDTVSLDVQIDPWATEWEVISLEGPGDVTKVEQVEEKK